MSAKKLVRLHWMQALVERRATQRAVAEQLGNERPPSAELRDAYDKHGPAGLVSARRGKRSTSAH